MVQNGKILNLLCESCMADPIRSVPFERDIEQAISLLKKGAYLLKYGRRGKPKFCPFKLAKDESVLIWYSGSQEKQLNLKHVSKIIPGQRTAIFQRYPRPDKEYQSFSLIYGERSLDLICKDKDEAEAWFVGLKALITRNNRHKMHRDFKADRISCDSLSTQTTKDSVLTQPFSDSDYLQKASKDAPENYQNQNTSHQDVQPTKHLKLSDFLFSSSPTTTDPDKNEIPTSVSYTPPIGSPIGRVSSYENLRVSMSSQVSTSSYGSGEDFDAMSDVLIWGSVSSLHSGDTDSTSPQALEATSCFDVHSVACGARHAVLVTKQGEVYSWGDGNGGRLGHGVDTDSSHPKLVMGLSGLSVEHVVCGEFHTCAVTVSGDMYTWGNGLRSPGLLGHGNDTSHWIPKQLHGAITGMHVSSVSCGPWHTAVVTSSGLLYTFGDGAFGALGHGDLRHAAVPRLVESLKELRTVQVACGVWHTAAVVEDPDMCKDVSSPCGKLFTWGDGDKGRLGHGDNEPRLKPGCVMSLSELGFCQVACGQDLTVALCHSGRVYTMGSPTYGQLGDPNSDGKLPARVGGNIKNQFVEGISCGANHVAVLTSKSEVYTWGKGANGRLGHGDVKDRNTPTLVNALKDKQVKSVVCGSDFTVARCLHKLISSVDQLICSGCRLPFNFRRKRHNCYNCGLVFCKNCSSRKTTRASLAPNLYKPHRVCDDCYNKLKKGLNGGPRQHTPNLLIEETVDRNSNGNGKVHGTLSRLSSIDPRSRPSVSRFIGRLPPLIGHANQSPINNGNGTHKSSKRMFSVSVPASRAASRSASPLSRRASTPTSAMAATAAAFSSPEMCFSGPHGSEDDLAREISKLRLQVEELRRESEIRKEQLEQESSKNRAANEVILSLSNQLKEIKESELHATDHSNITANFNGFPHTSAPEENHDQQHYSTSDPCSSGVACSNYNPLSSCKCNAIITQEEVIEQVEPGVYFTITFSRIGEKNLKRIRFSRKKFTEHQADAWWAENKSRLREKYSIVSKVAIRVQDPMKSEKINS